MRSVLKVSELNKSMKEWACHESLHEKYVLSSVDIGSVKKKWETFRDIVMDCTKDLWGGQRRMCSEWCSGEVMVW